MAWPTDSLTKTHFDAGTDSPSSARAELEALYDHVKLISAEVTDGETVWHSGNDGATSGLDADLLDGQHGSYYQDASNLNAGTIPLAQIPTNLTGKNADQLDGQEGSYYLAFANATGTVSQTQIAASAVGISQLKKTTQEITHDFSIVGGTITSYETLTGGKYNFFPVMKTSNTTGLGSIEFQIFNNTSGAISTSYQGLARMISSHVISEYNYVELTYIQSSPPYIVDGLEFDDFIFLQLGYEGIANRASIAKDPPWANNGPTETIPHRYVEGIGYRDEVIVPKTIKDLKGKSVKEYIQELKKLEKTTIKVDQSLKNKDRDLIPNPFNNQGEAILIHPEGEAYRDICALRDSGETAADVIFKYCNIVDTNSPIKLKNTKVCKLEWKNTGQ